MIENFNQNKFENYESNPNDEESDYSYLINKLKEIKTTIGLLEKNFLNKFNSFD